MRRTILYTTLALVLVYAGLPLLYPFGSDRRDFFAAFDGKWKAQERVPSPRILLIGGSNWLFGVDSRQLQDALGVPVYNLGLQADLGIPFFMDLASAAARPGDLILFSPEYRCRSGSTRTRALLQLESPQLGSLIEASPAEQLRLATQRAQITAAGLINTHLLNEYAFSNIYRADGFNRWGDLQTARNLPEEDYPLPAPMDTLIAPELRQMARFAHMARQKGIRFFYVPQPYPQKGLRQDSAAMRYLAHRVQKAGWPLLCKPEDMIFADTLFFDSPNHLLESAREQRTHILTRLLTPILTSTEVKSSH